MSRDETMYPDPEDFVPERFLDTFNGDVADPRNYFGFGRRYVHRPGGAATRSRRIMAR